jgi:phosphohistidine phosphatase
MSHPACYIMAQLAPERGATRRARHAIILRLMRRLLLLRHAKSSWDEPHLSDHARPLNVRGRQAAVAIAGEMRRLGLVPDFVLVSSSRRTLQTLAALEPWADPAPRVLPMDALYLAPASDLLDTLRQVPATAQAVLLVGHNPGMHDLAMMLAGAQAAATDKQVQRLAEGYPSGALCEFTVAVPWNALGEVGARLTRLLLPSDLSEVTLSQ